MKNMIKVCVLLLISTGLLAAEESYRDKMLEKLSQKQYHKSYSSLNTTQKEQVENNYDKRARIYTLAKKANIEQSSAYEDHMKMLGKEYAMRLFLQQHRENISITVQEMKMYYNLNKRDYTTLHAYTLVRSQKEDLGAYLKVLKSTPKEALEKTFITLAKAHSQHPRKSVGGDMGMIGYNTMAKPFGEKAFALEDNSYTTTPFKTVLGWHIVYVKMRKVTPFQKVKKRIEENLKAKKYKKWFGEL